jgi:hypothetical protein
MSQGCEDDTKLAGAAPLTDTCFRLLKVASRQRAANSQCRKRNSEATGREKPRGESLAAAHTFQDAG